MANRMARMLISSGLAMASTAVPVQAGVWNTAGQGQVGVNFDDNVRLTTDKPTAAWNGVADLSGQLLFQDDAFVWRLSPRVRAVRYDGERVLNRTEQYLTMSAQKKSERGSSSLSLNGTQDTTLTSELGLTGLAEVNKKHRSASVTLSNAWNLNERFNTNAQLYLSANRYLDAELTGLVDYNYGSALLSVGYNWTERSVVSLQASLGKLEVPDNAAYDKTNQAVTLGYGVQLAPRWHANISYGPSQVRTRNRSDRGTVYDAGVTRKSELSDLSLTISRDVTPTGRGSLTRREQMRLGLNQALGERWSSSWSVTAVRNRDLLPESGQTLSAVNYGDITGSLSWRMSPTWNLSLSAGYTQQRVDDGERTAERRHAALNISWNGLTRRLMN